MAATSSEESSSSGLTKKDFDFTHDVDTGVNHSKMEAQQSEDNEIISPRKVHGVSVNLNMLKSEKNDANNILVDPCCFRDPVQHSPLCP